VTRQAIALVAAVGVALIGIVATAGASGIFAAIIFWLIAGVLIYGFGSGR
jgi:hypothetical protein